MGPFPPVGGPAPGATMPGAVSPQPTQSLPPPAFGGLMPPGAEDQSQTYEAVTQADGTVLLHLKLPDGTLGPAVKIISVPKPKAAAGPSGPPSAQIPLPPLGAH